MIPVKETIFMLWKHRFDEIHGATIFATHVVSPRDVAKY